MRRLSFEVRGAAGLHARPAAELVECAQGFACDVTLHAHGASCDAKSVFGVLGLDVNQGDVVAIVCEGADEDAAALALQEVAARL